MSAAPIDQATPSASDGTGLSEETKETIRAGMNRLREVPGFKPRGVQRRMIAEVAKTLAGETDGESILCIEGPTGTGKSIGYLLPAIPVAQARGSALVIATATVALQEQLVGKDLPDLQARAGLEFTYALAKGRRRYVCDRHLNRLIGGENQANLDLGTDDAEQGTWSVKPAEGEVEEVTAMWQAREDGTWSGDLDEWRNPLRGELHGQVITDNAGCIGAKCPWRGRCAFYAARRERESKDVIVANHALVMADLMLGGGVVLPDPEETLYVFDEGHHLPAVAIEQGAAKTRLMGARSWLGDLEKLPNKAASALAGQYAIAEKIQDIGQQLRSEIPQLIQRLGDLHRAIGDAHPAMRSTGKPRGRQRNSRYADANWRFPEGQVPDDLYTLFTEARDTSNAVHSLTMKLAEKVKEALENNADNGALGTAASSINWTAARLDAMATAFTRLADKPADSPDMAPVARWIECQGEGTDFECCASPTQGGALLRELLWDRCEGAVVTSATLAALGRFDRFFESAGLGESFGTAALRLASPFDYEGRAELVVPAMRANVKDPDAHTAELIERINAGLVDLDAGTLVLFSSYRQMRAVAEGVASAVAQRILMQGTAPRHEILDQHRARIAAGEGSVIFGVASFAEGVDLPGAQCTHVIIAKLPFSVPDSPVEATYAEWLESSGRNPFMEMSVPDAAFRLTQAAGRLLRTESDAGRVTVLDRRLAERPYGQAMMNALPPFRRKIERT